MIAQFAVRNHPFFSHYVKRNWRYFLRKETEGIKIVIRGEKVYIHISQYYCVVCNDLKYLQRNGYLKAKNKKSQEWLAKYGD